jgi:protein SCO1/2
MIRSKTLVLLLLGAIALGSGIWLGQRLIQPPTPPEIDGIHLEQSLQLPDFELVHESGRPFTAADFRGRWTFVYFGYTYCPDACPMALGQLNVVDRALAESGNGGSTGYLLISVDPRRDTPERLAEYTKFFNPKFEGATGESSELEKLTRALGVLYRVPENPDDPDNYLVDHSSTVLLINPDGALQAVFTPPQDPSTMTADYLLIREHYRSVN